MMVKLLAGFALVHAVTLLELAGILLLTVAAGVTFGPVGVLVVIGVAALVKSFELDLGAKT